MIIYDFKCPKGHVFEAFAKISEITHICESCGSEANRIISAPRIKLEGHSGSFPSAHNKWVKMHEREGRKTTEE